MKKSASTASEIEYEASYKKGSSLYQRWFNIGWVELLKRTGKVYYCSHATDACYQDLMAQGKTRLSSLYATAVEYKNDDEDHDNDENLPKELREYHSNLGLAIHLASERLQRPWMLPPMARVKNNTVIFGTGLSRTAADFMCATPPEEIHFIIYVSSSDSVDLSKLFYKCQELNSTEEYVNTFGINDIDHRIRLVMGGDGQPEFTNSIISHTEYDYSTRDEASNFSNLSKNFIYKLKGMSNKEGQICVEIRCLEKHLQYIPKSDNRYKITVVPQKEEEWHWSYGRFLGLVNDKDIRESGPSMYLLLYDISAPLDLDLVCFWFGANATYQTKDKKLAAFTPGRSTSSIKEVGNFVK